MSHRILRALETLLALGAALLILRGCANAAPLDPIPGFWRQGNNAHVPCAGTKPYQPWVGPVDGFERYLRADASAMRTAGPEGHWDAFDCGDHCSMYRVLGMSMPLRGGHNHPSAGFTYPPMPVNRPIEFHPEVTVCDKYREFNGPDAPACPSGESLVQYSARIMGTATWQNSIRVYAAQIAADCSGAPPPTQSRTVTSGGQTRTPTRARTATRTTTPGCCPPGIPCPGDVPPCVPAATRTPTSIARTATAIATSTRPPSTRTATPRSSPSPHATVSAPSPSPSVTLAPSASPTPVPTPPGSGGSNSTGWLIALGLIAAGLIAWFLLKKETA